MAAVRHMEHAGNIEAVAMFKENGCLTEEVYNELAEKIINKVKDYSIIEEVERHNVLSVDIKIIPYEEYMLTKMEEVNV
jgi:hypothetical protein